MPKKKKKRSKFSSVDPAYMDKQRDALKRKYRKSILFNEQELAAIKEYCSRFKVSSVAALSRQSVMKHVLEGLEENHPTLF